MTVKTVIASELSEVGQPTMTSQSGAIHFGQ